MGGISSIRVTKSSINWAYLANPCTALFASLQVWRTSNWHIIGNSCERLYSSVSYLMPSHKKSEYSYPWILPNNYVISDATYLPPSHIISIGSIIFLSLLSALGLRDQQHVPPVFAIPFAYIICSAPCVQRPVSSILLRQPCNSPNNLQLDLPLPCASLLPIRPLQPPRSDHV